MASIWLLRESYGNITYFLKLLSGNDGLKSVPMSILFIFKAKSNTKLRLEIVVNILFLHPKSNSYCLKTKHFFITNGLRYMMKTNKKEKTFDAVKMMRDICDKISAETQNMTFEELKEYIESRIKSSGFKPIGQ